LSIVSARFFIFAIIVLASYYIVPKNYRWIVLLFFSIGFYLLSNPKSFVFLLLSAITTYLSANRIDKLNNNDDAKTKKIKKRILIVYLIANFGLLLSFKYYGLFSHALSKLLDQPGLFSRLALPLGISFYMFQSTGYVIDVYFGKVQSEKNFFKTFLFISFFPQIIQGPIHKFSFLHNQLITGHSFNFDRLIQGFQLMIYGYFKKLVIADRIAIPVNYIFDINNNAEGFIVFLGAFAYSIQIYADFSGGIDICRGFSQMLGITLENNFKRPYFAESISEFWQRWHITLGSWMREYVFYPLALSGLFTKVRKKLRNKNYRYLSKVVPTTLASFVVYILVGIWHGSSFKFVAFGIYHGTIISISTLLENRYALIKSRLKIRDNVFSYRLFKIVRTTFLVVIGRYFSRAARFLDVVVLYERTFKVWNPWVLADGSIYNLGLDKKDVRLLFIALIIMLVVSIYQERGYKIRETLQKQNYLFNICITVLAILFILIFGHYGSGLGASDFIYQGF